jgi:hypothetical protein
MKVKRESLLIFGTLYTQIGPSLKAIALNLAKPAMREELEKCFESRKYDAALQAFDWPKRSLMNSRNENQGQDKELRVALEVPRSDITEALSEDCILRLVSFLLVMDSVHHYIVLTRFVAGVEGGKDCVEGSKRSFG